jgi:hypothetical protein
MRKFAVVIAIGAVAVTPFLSQAQTARESSRWSMELNVDGAFPAAKLGDAELDAGLGFGGNVRVRLQRHLLAYAGWEWHHFATDNLIASQELDVEETGYTFGLRFEHPFRGESSADGRALGYWLRAGGTVNHLEIENDDGDLVADTKHGLGWEAGGGLTIPLRDRLALAPGVRYRMLSRDLTIGQTTRSVTLRYVTATVGFTVAF